MYLGSSLVALRVAMAIWAQPIVPVESSGVTSDGPTDQQIIEYWQSYFDHQPHFRDLLEEGWEFRIEPELCKPNDLDEMTTNPNHYLVVCYSSFWMKEPKYPWHKEDLASLWTKSADGWEKWEP